MTVAVWPTTLPRPDRNSWQASPMEVRLKRNAEAGPPAYRRRFSGVAKEVSLSIQVNRNGKAVFDSFHARAVKFGSLPFWMPDPTTDGWPLQTNAGAQLLTHDGRPILLAARWLCLFGDNQPSETIIGTEFRVSFSVTVMP